jgi:hypothetical protein
MAKKSKPKARKKVAAKDLTPKRAAGVKGGSKASGSQQEYLKVKMTDVFVSG